MNRKIVMKVILLTVTLAVIIYSKIWLTEHAENLAMARDLGNSGLGL